jgi:hypothetical protein
MRPWFSRAYASRQPDWSHHRYPRLGARIAVEDYLASDADLVNAGSEANYRYGARKSRYIGSAKARLQAAWAAALVNLNPIGHQLALHNA